MANLLGEYDVSRCIFILHNCIILGVLLGHCCAKSLKVIIVPREKEGESSHFEHSISSAKQETRCIPARLSFEEITVHMNSVLKL